MIRLAITGGLASGKSTVAALLRERGIPVADADAIGREVWPHVQAELAAVFGPGELTPARVAAAAFADAAKLAALNHIMHPAILQRTESQLDSWEREGRRAAGVDAALLLEVGLNQARRLPGFDKVVLVVADEAVRIQRFMARTGASEAEARARIARQWTDAEKLPHADVVLHNKGSLAELSAQVDSLVRDLQ